VWNLPSYWSGGDGSYNVGGMTRKRQQAELLFRLGQLVGPVLHVLENWDQYDSDDRERARARFFSDDGVMVDAVRKFVRAEPGHIYEAQAADIGQQLLSMRTLLASINYHHARNDVLRLCREMVQRITDQVLSIPISIDSTIHEAHTPFSTYCFVTDLCSTVRTQIVWLDRYFDSTIFHRYFVDTPKNAQVTLVTWPASKVSGGKDKKRYDEFMDMSKLFAAERGPAGYRLVTLENFHDRWLRCDDRLFTLGGSIKELAKPFTISKLDSTADNIKQFNDAVTTGVEVFGPNQTTHL
jgi:hypothetical protein